MTTLAGDIEDRFSGIDIESLLNKGGCQPLPHGRIKALYEAPEFIQRLSSEETVVEGQSLCIDCMVRGFPVPIIRWFKDDEEILDHPRIHVESNGIGGYFLIIDNVVKDDEAAYRCRAENVEGACSSFFFLSVKSKQKGPRKKEPRNSGWRTVSYPPMFSTIMERVEEEEQQGKEFEELPPSPLTEFYYALTLKGRQSWTTFVGDWAFTKVEFDDNDMEDEDENILDDDDVDDFYSDSAEMSPIYIKNGFVCDKLKFSASNQARLAAKRNLRRSELAKAKKKRLSEKETDNKGKQEGEKRTCKQKESKNERANMKNVTDMKTEMKRKEEKDSDVIWDKIKVEENDTEIEKETERAESKLMWFDRVKEEENLRKEKLKQDESKKGEKDNKNKEYNGEDNVIDKRSRESIFNKQTQVQDKENEEREKILEEEKQDFEESEKCDTLPGSTEKSRKKKEYCKNEKYTNNDESKTEILEIKARRQKWLEPSDAEKEMKIKDTNNAAVESVYQKVTSQSDNKQNACKYLDSRFTTSAEYAPTPDAIRIWKSGETNQICPETMLCKQPDAFSASKEKSPFRYGETNYESRIRRRDGDGAGSETSLEQADSIEKSSGRFEYTYTYLTEPEPSSTLLRFRKQKHLVKKQQTDQERLEELRQKEVERMEELRQEEQKRLEELKMKENSAMYTLHKKDRFQPRDLWTRQQLQVEELRRKEQLQREELWKKEQKLRDELHNREEKQKEALYLKTGRDEFLTQTEQYQNDESIARQIEELKMQEYIQRKDLKLKEVRHKEDINTQEEIQKEELIVHERNQVEELKMRQQQRPYDAERINKEERVRKMQKEEQDYIRREQKKEQLRKEQLRRQYQDDVRRHKKKLQDTQRQKERDIQRGLDYNQSEKIVGEVTNFSSGLSRDFSEHTMLNNRGYKCLQNDSINPAQSNNTWAKDRHEKKSLENNSLTSVQSRNGWKQPRDSSLLERQPETKIRINIIEATEQESQRTNKRYLDDLCTDSKQNRYFVDGVTHLQENKASGRISYFEDFPTSSKETMDSERFRYRGDLTTHSLDRPRKSTFESRLYPKSEEFQKPVSSSVVDSCLQYLAEVDARKHKSDLEHQEKKELAYRLQTDSQYSSSQESRLSPSRMLDSTYSRLSKSPSPSRLSPSRVSESYSTEQSQWSTKSSYTSDLSNLSNESSARRSEFREFLTPDLRMDRATSFSNIPTRSSYYDQDSYGTRDISTQGRAVSWRDDLNKTTDVHGLETSRLSDVTSRDTWRNSSQSSLYVRDRTSAWYRPRLIYD